MTEQTKKPETPVASEQTKKPEAIPTDIAEDTQAGVSAIVQAEDQEYDAWLDKKPSEILIAASQGEFEGKPWKEDLVKMAVEQGVKQDIDQEILGVYEIIKNYEWGRKAIETMLLRNPNVSMFGQKTIKNLSDWEKSLLKKILPLEIKEKFFYTGAIYLNPSLLSDLNDEQKAIVIKDFIDEMTNCGKPDWENFDNFLQNNPLKEEYAKKAIEIMIKNGHEEALNCPHSLEAILIDEIINSARRNPEELEYFFKKNLLSKDLLKKVLTKQGYVWQDLVRAVEHLSNTAELVFLMFNTLIEIGNIEEASDFINDLHCDNLPPFFTNSLVKWIRETQPNYEEIIDRMNKYQEQQKKLDTQYQKAIRNK